MNHQLPDKGHASSKEAEAGDGRDRGGSSSRVTDTTHKSQRPISVRTLPALPPSSRLWLGLKDPRIVRVSRALGGKDRHSKVSTVRGLRDRRVRLSVQTAIQLYDLQDRLGLSQPSKVVDWLLAAAQHEIDKLPPLHFPPHFLHVGRVVSSTATSTVGLGHADRSQQVGAQQVASGRRNDHGWTTTNWGSINPTGGQEGGRQRSDHEVQNNDNREVGQQSNSAISYFHLIADQSNSDAGATSTGAAASMAVGCYTLQPTTLHDDLNCQYYGYRPAPASPLSLLPALGAGVSPASTTALLFCPSGAMAASSVFHAGHTSSFDPKLLGHFHSVASTTNSSLTHP